MFNYLLTRLLAEMNQYHSALLIMHSLDMSKNWYLLFIHLVFKQAVIFQN